MFETIAESIRTFATWLWGPPMIIFLLAAGIYLTVRLKGLQFRLFFRAAKFTVTKRKTSGEGNLTPLQSLYSALGGIIGNGNLAGAATALFMGGPGALFWMWIGSFIGMIIVFSETFLAITHRQKSPDGTFSGGPMFYILKVLKIKWLAAAFALAMGLKALLATSMIQSNSISLAATTLIDMSWLPEGIPVQLPFCILLALMTWLVVIGGLRSIARVLEKVTPFMVITFILLVIVILFVDRAQIVSTVELVFNSAFNKSSAVGGFAGASVLMAMRYGFARGFYSSEAGTGSSSIMFSTAKTGNAFHQSLISMFGVFIDTVVSTCTLLAILVTGAWTSGLTSTALTTEAFAAVFGGAGGILVLSASFLFGFSTLIAWCFYGEQCFAFVWGIKFRLVFRWLFSIAILFGFMKVEFLWSIGDLLNGTLITINLAAITLMVGYLVKKLRSGEVK